MKIDSPFEHPKMACKGCGREVKDGDTHTYCHPWEVAIWLSLIVAIFVIVTAVVIVQDFLGG